MTLEASAIAESNIRPWGHHGPLEPHKYTWQANTLFAMQNTPCITTWQHHNLQTLKIHGTKITHSYWWENIPDSIHSNTLTEAVKGLGNSYSFFGAAHAFSLTWETCSGKMAFAMSHLAQLFKAFQVSCYTCILSNHQARRNFLCI